MDMGTELDLQISEEPPLPEEYLELRSVCGLGLRTISAAELALPRSLYAVTIRSEGKLVGMGRLVGDLGCHVQVTDIAVHPSFQGKGLGRRVMNHIMSFVDRECPRCCYVSLFADVDYLYEKFGFVPSTRSKGMYLNRGILPI